jgi:hypothetical protein
LVLTDYRVPLAPNQGGLSQVGQVLAKPSGLSWVSFAETLFRLAGLWGLLGTPESPVPCARHETANGRFHIQMPGDIDKRPALAGPR